jgi:excisionase family DNA binding protein
VTRTDGRRGPAETLPEAARIVGLSEVTMRRLAREGRLPVLRIGRLSRISREQLERWASEPGDARERRYEGAAFAERVAPTTARGEET